MALRASRLVFFVLALCVPVLAQSPVTSADLTRLDQTADDVSRQLATLKKTDVTLAAELDRALADLRDEIAYLKVKLRKDGVTRTDYTDVRDRLETLRVRSAGERVTAQPMLPKGDETSKAYLVPVGTQFDTRLQTSLSSKTARLEQRFETTTILDYTTGGHVVVPAGSVMRGFVSSVKTAGKIDRQGSITLSFDEIVIGTQHLKLRASVDQAMDGKMTEDATRIGIGATVGGILGAIMAGGKGALVGILIGGGGTIAATDGADVDLPAGVILRVRIDQPLSVG